MKKSFTPEEILEAIKKYYKESIFITDGEGNVIFVNDLGAERLHSRPEDILGRNVDDLVEGGMYESSTTRRVLETKMPYTGTIDPSHKHPTVSHSIPVFDDGGNIEMVVTANMSLEHNQEWESIISNERGIAEKLQREIENIRTQELPMLVLESEASRKTLDSVRLFAPTDYNVVITGESGTGKDLTARYIHQFSNRKNGAFISINCAAIPEQLLESELFGYEAGAFTGALSKGKIGLIEAADGGTLFLDEIGEMPMGLQAKLLNAIEDRKIRKVGGVESIPVDVRIISATNANLSTLIKQKKFREDLYYRLAVFTIQLLPLRERKEDILPLAERFLAEMNRKNGTRKYLSDEAKESMLRHNWPGNIRELRNVVERIFVICASDGLEFLPMPTFGIPVGLYESDKVVSSGNYGSLREYVSEAEKIYIERIIEETGGNMTEAAKKLGMDRSALYRKCKNLNICCKKTTK